MSDHYTITDSNVNNNKSLNYSTTVENSSRKISASPRRYVPWCEKVIPDLRFSNEVLFEKPSTNINISKSTKRNKFNNINSLNNNLYLTGIDETNEILSPRENIKFEPPNSNYRRYETVSNRNRIKKKLSNGDTFLPLIHRSNRYNDKNHSFFNCCGMELSPVYLSQLYNKQLIEGSVKKIQTLESTNFDKICESKKLSRSTNKDGPKEYIMKTNEINRIKYCLNHRNESIKEHQANLKKYIKGLDFTIQSVKNYTNNLENNFIKKFNYQLRLLSKQALDEKLKEEEQIKELNKLRKEVNNILYLIRKTEMNKQSIEKWLCFQILLKEGKRIDLNQVSDYIKKNYKDHLIIDTVSEFEILFEEKEQKNLRLMQEMEINEGEVKAVHNEFLAIKKDVSSDNELSITLLEKKKLLSLIKKRNEELIAQRKKLLKKISEARNNKTISFSSNNNNNNNKKDNEINFDHIYEEINKIFKYILKYDIESIEEHKNRIYSINNASSKSLRGLMRMKVIEYSFNYLSIYFKNNHNEKNAEIIKLFEDFIEKEHKKRKAEKYKNERKQKEIELYKQLQEKKDRVFIQPYRKIDDLTFIRSEKKKKEEKIKAKNSKKREINIFDFLYHSDTDDDEEDDK